MPTYRLRTFGGLSLERDGVEVASLGNQRKALALLAVLATAGRSGIGREQVMALLWSESDTERARGSLKQMLHTLRRQLGNTDAILGTSDLRLNAEIIDDDVGRFRKAIRDGDHAGAVALYDGPFLDGVYVDGAAEFERWASTERGELARLYAESLERLAMTADASGQRSDAVTWWRRLHATDPLNARSVAGLMRALDAAGDRAGALRQARAHQALLHEALGAPPDRKLAELAEQLMTGGTGRISAIAERMPADSDSRADEGVVASASATPAPLAAGPERAPRVAPRRWWAALVISLGVLASATLIALRVRDESDASLLPGRVAVAVLVNRTGDTALDPLGTMASDWVTRGLARMSIVDVFDVGGLYLQGRTADGAAADPRALARSNGAALVVAGNYYRTGDSLVFSMQVIDVANGRVLRALDPIAAPVSDPMTAIDELRQRVASALATIVDPRVSLLNTSALRPPRYDAYREFVAGQEIYWRGEWERSLPYFRRAAALDTTFFTALSLIGVVGVGTGRCSLTDSVARELAIRGDRVSELDGLQGRISQARCASDHAEHNRLQRQRAALVPGSKQVQFTMSTGFRQLNLAAEAQAILSNIDPVRDLGWIPASGRSFYWREVAAVQHALGEYEAERATAVRMGELGGSRLAAGYFAARSLAELGHPDSVVTILGSIADAPNDPALLSGITGGRLSAVGLATPGWVMYQAALELSARGHEQAALTAAQQSIAWIERRGPVEQLPVEQRFVLAQALAFVSRLDESRNLLAALVRADTTMIDFRGALGVVAARQHDAAVASATDQWLAGRHAARPPGAPILYRAELAAVRGDTARAMELIGAMPNGAHPYDWLQFHIDPAFAELRKSERFRRFLLPKG